MKKVSLIMCAIAMMSVCFTSCKKEPVTPIEDIIENGFYVVGEATGFANLSTSGVSVCQMAVGFNEAQSNAVREGMYEKYIVLEGGKEFHFIEKAGELNTQYTAPIEKTQLVADGQNPEGYFGKLSAGTAGMKVEETGLYHIVLDLNKDKQLDAAGGAQVIIAPVSWGISGGMNGWSMTVGQKAANAYTWTWENVEIPAGTEFKFKDEHGWKIFLDGETQQVSANTNLGKDLIPGGDNIKVEEGGVYNLTLSWTLAKGAIADNYKSELKKTGDLVLNPATFVVGISGTMNNWGDPAGATLGKLNESKTKVDDAKTKAGTYVFNLTGVTFAADAQFKFRVNGGWLGLADVTEATGVTLSEADGNITGVEGTYDIEMTIAWDGAKMSSLKVAFTEGTPQATTNIKVTGIVPEGWAKCYLWAWNGAGNFFAEWPGQELEIKDGKVAYEFKDVVAPINVIFSNGEGAQTNDITDISADKEIDIASNLK